MEKGQDPGSGTNIPDPQHWKIWSQFCESLARRRTWQGRHVRWLKADVANVLLFSPEPGVGCDGWLPQHTRRRENIVLKSGNSKLIFIPGCGANKSNIFTKIFRMCLFNQWGGTDPWHFGYPTDQDPQLWLTDPDPSPALDPALFVSDLSDDKQNSPSFFCLLLFETTITSFIKD